MKFSSFFFTVLAALAFAHSTVLSQTAQKDRIVLFVEGSVALPADRMQYTVWLTSSDSINVTKLYEKYKIQEKKLVELLNRMAVPASAVKYYPMTVGKEQRGFDALTSEDLIQARQWVEIMLERTSDYPRFEQALVQSGFIDFTARFGSSRESEADSLANRQAIEKARKQAEAIAANIGRRIKRIAGVYNADDTEPTFQQAWSRFNRVEIAESKSGFNSLSDIIQSITWKVNLKVVFDLAND